MKKPISGGAGTAPVEVVLPGVRTSQRPSGSAPPELRKVLSLALSSSCAKVRSRRPTSPARSTSNKSTAAWLAPSIRPWRLRVMSASGALS